LAACWLSSAAGGLHCRPLSRPRPIGRSTRAVTYENISTLPSYPSSRLLRQDTSPFLTNRRRSRPRRVAAMSKESERIVRGRDGRPVYIRQPGTGASSTACPDLAAPRPAVAAWQGGESVSGGKRSRHRQGPIVPAVAPSDHLSTGSASSTPLDRQSRPFAGSKKPSSIPASAKAPPVDPPRQKVGTPSATARTRKPPQPPPR